MNSDGLEHGKLDNQNYGWEGRESRKKKKEKASSMDKSFESIRFKSSSFVLFPSLWLIFLYKRYA